MTKQDLIEYGALLTAETQGYHFLLSAGGHSDQYVQCESLMKTCAGRSLVENAIVDTEWYSKLYNTFDIGKDWKNLMPDVVIGGALGGIRFATLVENLLNGLISYRGFKPTVRSIFCERKSFVEADPKDFAVFQLEGWSVKDLCKHIKEKAKVKSGDFYLKRGFEIKKGEKVLIAEDVTTTAKSIIEVIHLVQSYKADIVGVISIIDRRKEKYGGFALEGKEIPYMSLIQLDIPTWTPEECLLCQCKKYEGDGTCTQCSGDNYGHATEISSDYCRTKCKNYEPKSEARKQGSRR